MISKTLFLSTDKCEKRVLLKNVEIADTFGKRMMGLLTRNGFSTTEGLLITPCNVVHTFGMKFAIDLVFIDKANQVIGVKKSLCKNKIAGVFGAKHTLELPAGKLEQLNIGLGDILEWH